jgi:hypothetical protein
MAKPNIGTLHLHDVSRVRIQRDLETGCLDITVEGTTEHGYTDRVQVLCWMTDLETPPPFKVEPDRAKEQSEAEAEDVV